MSTVRPNGKHHCRVNIDDIAFFYSKKCTVLPRVHLAYIDKLSQLETQGKICLTPAAILERYHIQLKKRSEEKRKKSASK